MSDAGRNKCSVSDGCPMDSGSRTVSAACEEQKKLSAERRAASICLFAASIQVRFFPGQEEEEDEGIIYSLADDF